MEELSRVGRKCTVCEHNDRATIELAIVNGISVPAISAKYQLSESSLYRHSNTHLRDHLKLSAPVANDIVVQRLEEIIESARRWQKRHAGSLPAQVRAAELELKAIGVLATRLGVENSDALESVQAVTTILEAVGAFIKRHPANAGPLVAELEARTPQLGEAARRTYNKAMRGHFPELAEEYQDAPTTRNELER